jgi:hypothetical protein
VGLRALGRSVQNMDLTRPSRGARIALVLILALVLAFFGLQLWASKKPLFDPAPKGDGSFKEIDAITSQFRDFYHSHDTKVLPKGFVRLEGFGDEGPDGTWVVYYATASHAKVRGGTIMLLDSFGRIDTYFGHHCTRVDGGKVMVSEPGITNEYYEGGVESVRTAFAKAFKFQKTEQAASRNGP